jgi:hypothetical protein
MAEEIFDIELGTLMRDASQAVGGYFLAAGTNFCA